MASQRGISPSGHWSGYWTQNGTILLLDEVDAPEETELPPGTENPELKNPERLLELHSSGNSSQSGRMLLADVRALENDVEVLEVRALLVLEEMGLHLQH